ncbi:MAG: NAD(P)H-dependent oxidoreductase [Streptosporangiales bacterium]|nr:NAD(P)H-dependent oxidoreductase [Streptosporangiales bacterium]
MAAETTILTLLGSLRRQSVNGRLLDLAAGYAPDGTRFTRWAGLRDLPPFSEDDEADPGHAVFELRDVIAAADAVLIATPEYNGSLPGQLKNALDWASRPRGAAALDGKPVTVIGASPSPGGTASAQEHARVVLTRSGARPVGEGLRVPHAYDVLGAPVAGWLASGLTAVLAELTDAATAGSRALVA